MTSMEKVAHRVTQDTAEAKRVKVKFVAAVCGTASATPRSCRTASSPNKNTDHEGRRKLGIATREKVFGKRSAGGG